MHSHCSHGNVEADSQLALARCRQVFRFCLGHFVPRQPWEEVLHCSADYCRRENSDPRRWGRWPQVHRAGAWQKWIPSLVFTIFTQCLVYYTLFLGARQKLSGGCRWCWKGLQASSSCCPDPCAGKTGALSTNSDSWEGEGCCRVLRFLCLGCQETRVSVPLDHLLLETLGEALGLSEPHFNVYRSASLERSE